MIKLIKKHQQGGNLSKEDKDILWQFRGTFGGDNSKEEYFNTWNFQKGDKQLENYFNSYLNSEGFNRIINNQNKWWKKRHPYRKWYSSPDPYSRTKEWFEVAKEANPYIYTVDMYQNLSFANLPSHLQPTRAVFIGRGHNIIPNSETNQKFPYAFTAGHEYLHGKTPLQLGFPASFWDDSAQAEALAMNKNAKINKHDEFEDEKHADIWGLKYLLFKEGIYDSRSKKDITLKQVKQLRKKYPKLRPLQQMTDEQIVFMLNHVAQNTDYQEPTVNTYYNG